MRKYLPFAVLVAALMLCSCLKSPRYSGPHEKTDDEHTSELDLKEQITRYTHIVNDDDELFFIVDSIVTNAENLTLDGDHQSAQNLIKIIFEIFSIPEESSENTDLILYRIARLYVEKMPPNYIDSIPMSITAFVTQYQFQVIMSEIDTANIDISNLPINCVKDVLFNIPVTYNKRVQQAMLVLLAANRSERMIRLLNRSMIYRPFMVKMYEEAGLPTDITYLPLLESAFNPKAYSKAHASGLWQFIPSTGRIFGLRDSYWLDERRDPIKSTEASIAYFKRLYELFGDWYLALASYNCGEGRVGRHIRNGKEANPDSLVTYWDLQLPSETMNYVPLYIGYQIIGKNPKCFGFFPDTSIVAFPYDTVKVSDCIDMAKIAKGIGISTDSLRNINPHIKQFCTPPDAKNVTLYIPLETKELYNNFYATLTPEDKVKWYRYKVASGDNLNSISKKFGASVQAIKDMNRMKSNTLAAGRYILLPLPDNETTAQNIIKADEEEKKAAAAAAPKIQKPTDASGKVNYRVSSGETLYSISRLYEITVNDIMAWNPKIKPRYLREGDIVVIYTDKHQISQQAQQTEKKTESTTTANSATNTTNTTATTPATQTAQTQTADKKPDGEQQKYVVRNGDNLFQISLKLKVSLSDLIAWNNKDSDNPIIYPGETLLYYQGSSTKSTTTAQTQTNVKEVKTAVSGNSDVINYRVNVGDTFYSIAKTFSTTIQELEVLNGFKARELKAGQIIKVLDKTPTSLVNPKAEKVEKAKEKEPETKDGLMSYKVQNGDYLYKLASKFNVSVQEICIANNFSQDRKLMVGEVIKIPTKN
ncbi:MAG: LysM peptidoglycan-binding domain-containing protein [Chitinivibrionia bacterium]|nr:LysM peptidoglycan-binding domain-containing protein [Chitinivibrionia bacterium]